MRNGMKITWTLVIFLLMVFILASCVEEQPPLPEKYTVTFNADNGSTPVEVEVEKGKTVAEPNDPVKAGFTFEGWFLGASEFDFQTPIVADITLVAQWEEVIVPVEEYDVTFNSVGGDAVPMQTVESGDLAAAPGAPTKMYFSFQRWLLDGEAFDFSTPITADITLVAEYSFIGIPDSPADEGRVYNEDFDQPLDGSMDGTVAGTPLASNASIHADQPFIRVGYSGLIGGDPDGALWKQAGGANAASATFQYLVLRLRGSHGASIHDLSIGFRLDDNHEVLVVPFVETLDPDLEPNVRELDGTWHNYVISIPDTLDGKSYIGKQTHPDVLAGGSLVGFHLMNTSETGSGILEIKDVYYSKSPNPIYPYEGSDYNQNKDYWSGTVGTVVSDYKTIQPDGFYGQFLEEGVSDENTHLVLRLKQEMPGTLSLNDLLVAPVFDDGTVGTPVALSSIDGIPTLGSGWLNVTIAFADFYDGEGVVSGYKLINESDVAISISDAFLSYLGEYEAANYPLLDLTHISMFDTFDRATIGATGEFTVDNPVALDNDFSYIISYGGLQASTIGDGYITFDSTGGDYISYKVHSTLKSNLNQYRYLVFKYKLNDTGTLDDLRVQQLTSNDAPVAGVIYANQWVAGLGLSSIPEDMGSYPYIDGDWTYLIVDLELTEGFSTDFGGFEIYYTGSSLSFDAIFFANPVLDLDPSSQTAVADFEAGVLLNDSQYDANDYGSGVAAVEESENFVLHMPNNGDNWTQYWANYKEYGRYLQLDIRVPEGSSLNNLRIGDSTGKFVWVNSGNLLMANGLPLYVPANNTFYTVIIDLIASGYSLSPYWTIGSHGNELYFDNISFYDAMPAAVDEFVFATFEGGNLATADATQYWQSSEGTPNISVVLDGENYVLKLDGVDWIQYATGVQGVGEFLAFSIKLDEGSDLSNLRFQSNTDAANTKWVKDGGILLVDGTPLAIDAIPDDGSWHQVIIQWTGSGLALTDTIRIALDGGDVVYLDNLAWWRMPVEPTYPIMSFDFVEGIDGLDPNFYWHNGEPTDGVMNIISADYAAFGFGSPVIGGAAYIKFDIKLAAGNNADTFRIEMGGSNVINWSVMIEDGVVPALTEEFQTVMIPLSMYVSNLGAFDTLQFHINNGGVIIDNLEIGYDSYGYQMSQFNNVIGD